MAKGSTTPWPSAPNYPAPEFSFASDVIFEEGSNVANLIIGVKRQNSVDGAFVYKFDRANPDETKVFYFGGGFDLICKNQNGEFYGAGEGPVYHQS